MTAVEKFRFGVREYLIHIFQLPTFKEGTDPRKGKIKITSLDKTFTRYPTHRLELCSVLVLFVCLFEVAH